MVRMRGLDQVGSRNLRDNPAWYLSLLFIAPIFSQFSQFLAPESVVLKGQPASVITHVTIFIAGFLAWLVYSPGRPADRPWAFSLLILSLVCLSVVFLGISIWRHDLFNHTAWLLPASLILIWLKPPSREAAWRTGDVVALSILAICLATQAAEWLHLQSAWTEFPLRWTVFPDFLKIPSRWEGPFGNVNYAGPIGVFLLIYGLCRPTWRRILIAGSGLWIILIAQTRGSLVSSAAGVGVLYILLPKSNRFAPPMLIKVIISIAALFAVAASFLISETGLNGRWEIWKVFVQAWHDSPFTGISSAQIAEYRLNGTLPPYVFDGHSIFMDTLGRYGSIGFLALLFFLAAALVISIRATKYSMSVSLAVLIAFTVNGITETALDLRYLSVFLGPILLVLLLASLADEDPLVRKTSELAS
jgi:hypothetical protein